MPIVENTLKEKRLAGWGAIGFSVVHPGTVTIAGIAEACVWCWVSSSSAL